jgi:hypothetical protein
MPVSYWSIAAKGRLLVAAFQQRNPALWWMLGATSATMATILAPATPLRLGPLHGDDVAMAIAADIAGLGLLDVLKRMIGPGRAFIARLTSQCAAISKSVTFSTSYSGRARRY